MCAWVWKVKEKRNGDGGCDAGEGHREFSGLSGLPLYKLCCVLGTSGKCSVTDRQSCSLLFPARLYTHQASTAAQRCVLNRIRWRSDSLLALTRRRPRWSFQVRLHIPRCLLLHAQALWARMRRRHRGEWLKGGSDLGFKSDIFTMSCVCLFVCLFDKSRAFWTGRAYSTSAHTVGFMWHFNKGGGNPGRETLISSLLF